MHSWIIAKVCDHATRGSTLMSLNWMTDLSNLVETNLTTAEIVVKMTITAPVSSQCRRSGLIRRIKHQSLRKTSKNKAVKKMILILHLNCQMEETLIKRTQIVKWIIWLNLAVHHNHKVPNMQPIYHAISICNPKRKVFKSLSLTRWKNGVTASSYSDLIQIGLIWCPIREKV